MKESEPQRYKDPLVQAYQIHSDQFCQEIVTRHRSCLVEALELQHTEQGVFAKPLMEIQLHLYLSYGIQIQRWTEEKEVQPGKKEGARVKAPFQCIPQKVMKLSFLNLGVQQIAELCKMLLNSTEVFEERSNGDRMLDILKSIGIPTLDDLDDLQSTSYQAAIQRLQTNLEKNAQRISKMDDKLKQQLKQQLEQTPDQTPDQTQRKRQKTINTKIVTKVQRLEKMIERSKSDETKMNETLKQKKASLQKTQHSKEQRRQKTQTKRQKTEKLILEAHRRDEVKIQKFEAALSTNKKRHIKESIDQKKAQIAKAREDKRDAKRKRENEQLEKKETHTAHISLATLVSMSKQIGAVLFRPAKHIHWNGVVSTDGITAHCNRANTKKTCKFPGVKEHVRTSCFRPTLEIFLLMLSSAKHPNSSLW
jgi:hypothetical protein